MAKTQKHSDTAVIRTFENVRITEPTYQHLQAQIDYVHKMAVAMTLRHLAAQPGNRVEKLYAETVQSHARLYNPKKKRPPIDPERLEIADISPEDLPLPERQLLDKCFTAYHQQLLGRYEHDDHKKWASMSALPSLKSKVSMEVTKGNLPYEIPVLLGVCAELAQSTKKTDWKTILEKKVNAGGGKPQPPGRGA